MHRFKKFLKGFWLYSFLVEIIFIAYVFCGDVFGIGWFTSTVSGWNAVFILVMCYSIVFAPFWIILLLFQINCAIIFRSDSTYKKMPVKSYFKSWKFYIPILIVILACLVYSGVRSFVNSLPYNYTDDFNNCLRDSYSVVVPVDNIEGVHEDGYVGLHTYSELCDIALNYETNDLLFELWNNCDNQNFSPDYIVLITPVEHGTFIKDSIWCSSAKHYLGKEVKLKLSYSIKDCDSNNVMISYFKINDKLNFIDDELNWEWIK